MRKEDGSVWQALAADPESRSTSFSTGDEPKSIPANNVAYSYPLKNQYNFYKSEYQKGYIKLIYGQPSLFNPESDGTKWVYLARFKNRNQTIDVPVSYNPSEAMVYYDFPTGMISSSVYEMTIVKKPAFSGAVDRNLKRGETMIQRLNADDSLRLATTEITGDEISGGAKVLHSFSFRTSLYSTFNEKLRSFTNWKNQPWIIK